MKSYLWNRELELGFAFWWKGTTLYPRGISRQVLNTSNVKKSKKSAYSNKQHRLQQRRGTARLVFRALAEVLRPQTHWTSTWANATVHFHSPPSLPSPPTSRPVQASFWQECGLGAFLATARWGLASFPPGRNINWGSRLPNLLLLQ